ncbi:heme-binding protein [Patescibacteria group bacterium]|nr:heme-binding protein [Patescibacteria group bacterium]
MYITLAVVALLLIVWTALSYLVEHSVKTPAYSVIEKRGGYEVRLYEPYITARVEVGGTYEKALNEGFSILADYIFGNNTRQAGIAMTAPVIEGASEKMAMTAPVMVKDNQVLAMTAPVITSSKGAGRTVSFVMPFEYTLETLPKPNNPRIEIVPQEARKVAVLRFSWFRDSERIAKKKQELLSLLEKDSVVIVGEPEYAGYNAPLTAPWLNRNEILVEIK